MKLTNDQEQALKVILQRYKDNEKYVTICGYAGVGKSTLVRFAIEALNVDENKVVYCSYTGKAAEVLRKKGNKNAMTLHKLLYDSFPRPGGGFYRKPKTYLEYNIVVVDEISLAPKSMLEMLLKHNVFCIFIGDNFQLPQIDKNESHDFLEHPHVFLSTVMRQAAESEIIQLTMKIRNGEDIPYSEGKETIIIPKKELVTGHMLWANQIICATNATRVSLNNQMRELLGYSGSPQSGEKMICLRNYWEDFSEDGDAVLVNGTTGILKNPFETFIVAPNYIKMRNHKMDIICGNFISDEGKVFQSVEMDKVMIATGESCLNWQEQFALGKIKNKIGDIIPRQFTYGYAITAHKAQGSEFDKVLVLEERFPFDKIEHARWLYTAATRSAEKLVLVR
jgi:ATP-dependent exoDNAse (exonuclease V) alpha subunit